MPSSPKIQRLVTPLRLQRRRHLHSLKKRKLEHQKEQKAEYECVQTFLSPFLKFTFVLPLVSSLPSVLPRKRPGPPPSKHRITRVRNPSTLRPVFREACKVYFVDWFWLGSSQFYKNHSTLRRPSCPSYTICFFPPAI